MDLVLGMLRRVGMNPCVASFALLILSLGSPLTIYGALYWEHTLSILLSFSAVVFCVTQPVSAKYALLLGLLSGLAVWFRPETMLLCLLFMATVLFKNSRKKDTRSIMFISAALAGLVSFFVFNAATYGNILGAHSYQLSNAVGPAAYFREKLIILLHINARLVIYFPVMLLFLALAGYMLIKKPLSPLISQLTIIILLYAIITPFVLPNAGGKQWGPRYFLPLVPIVITSLALASGFFDTRKFMKPAWIWLLTLLIAYSIYLNVFKAHESLKNDYAFRVKPGLDFLNHQSCDVLIVQNQFIAQEFASVFATKKIFLAGNQPDFNRLCLLLKSAGVPRVIYMTSDSNNVIFSGNTANKMGEFKKMGGYYFKEYSLK
jgi:hypothetical protein